jgi:signal transduction histidine kinase
LLVRSVQKEISNRKKIESLAKDLEKANDHLKDLDKLKSEFLSLASHQIRAPLGAIKGYLSEIFEGDFGPVTKEVEAPLHIVYQSTENLVTIVNDFLNISRIEQGNMKYELSVFDFKKAVEEVAAAIKPNIDRKGLTFSMEAQEGNYMVNADIGKIKQIVGNLMDNSIKYTPSGWMKAILTVDETARTIRLGIKDSGVGIAKETISQLFQKFTRAQDANRVNIMGTGLGLYVAKLMMEAQHGKIWVESEGKGKGSTFFIELPMA